MKSLKEDLSENVERYDALRSSLAAVCAHHHDNDQELDPRIVVGVLLEMSIGLYMNMEGASKQRFLDASAVTYDIMAETFNAEMH
jgi:hypothetical protein